MGIDARKLAISMVLAELEATCGHRDLGHGNYLAYNKNEGWIVFDRDNHSLLITEVKAAELIGELLDEMERS